MSWEAVRRWRDATRELQRSGELPRDLGLSEAGAREALADALGALDDVSLERAAARRGAPWSDAVIVAASTVFTAPIEWCALLLGRGSRVHLKWSARAPGLGPWLVEAAARVGLPLAGGDDRSVVERGQLVVVMGSDRTVAEVRAALPAGRTLAAHGHGASLAWVTGDASWDALARDLAMHDGRGCLSPLAIFTTQPLDAAVDRLAAAMARAEQRWPRGRVHEGEAASTRERWALSRAVGVARRGPGWEVHGLPAGSVEPRVLPRCPAVATVEDLAAAMRVAERWTGLASVGTDDPDSAETWRALGVSRVCAPGEMQRPPLARLQDGVDWIAETIAAG